MWSSVDVAEFILYSVRTLNRVIICSTMFVLVAIFVRFVISVLFSCVSAREHVKTVLSYSDASSSLHDDAFKHVDTSSIAHCLSDCEVVSHRHYTYECVGPPAWNSLDADIPCTTHTVIKIIAQILSFRPPFRVL